MTDPGAGVARAVVIGGGPAGLMAAEVLSIGGVHVDVFDAMPSVGRKFLLAGKGGLNLTHVEDHASFLARYGASRAAVEPWLRQFAAPQLRQWVHDLGIETFVGSSGRVFPAGMKAAPLLRAWLRRLRSSGVEFHTRHRWLGFADGAPAALRFGNRDGQCGVSSDATVLALGGASWPRLGSDGAWVDLLGQRGVSIAPLRSANCGFDVNWSELFRGRFAGTPVKGVAVAAPSAEAGRRGEVTITHDGIEGGLIYALSAPLREAIALHGATVLTVDLVPDWSAARLTNEITKPRGSSTWSRHLRRRVGLDAVKLGLLYEAVPRDSFADVVQLVRALKALPLRLLAPRPVHEAISTAGGVRFCALDAHSMLNGLPGVFCAGEMLDWEAPTGGYLLTACFASGRAAGAGALAWLRATHAD